MSSDIWRDPAAAPQRLRASAAARKPLLDPALLREMHRVLFRSPVLTTQHLLGFADLLKAAGFNPREVIEVVRDADE